MKLKEKITNKNPYKAHTATKKVLVMALVGFFSLLLVGTVSAFEFDNIKELPNNFNYKDDILTIRNSFLWIFPLGKVADIQLVKNTDQCLINCKTKFKVKLYADYNNPLTREYFRDRGNKNVDASGEWYYYDNSSYEIEIPEYRKICEVDLESINGSKICFNEKVGSHNETKYYSRWLKYEGGTFKEGEYEFEYRGQKPINKDVDFKIILFGVDLGKEYVWWNGTWNKKRELSNLTAEGTASIVYLNISYDSNMQTDFDDIRFLDSAEANELGYYLQQKSDSNWAVFRVKSNNESSIYMYYNNSVASSNSDIFSVYEDGLISAYFLERTSGDVIDERGINNGTNSGAARGVTGIIGNAFDFESSESDYINVSNSASLETTGDNITVSMWIKKESTSHTGVVAAMWEAGDSAPERPWIFLFINDLLRIDINNHAVQVDATGTITDTNWHHVAFTYNKNAGSDQVKLYIDGVLNNSGTYSTSIDYSDAVDLGFGAERVAATPATFFDGLIDEAEIWSESKSAEGISVLYNIQEPTYVLGDEETLPTITIVLNSPVDNYNSTNSTIIFNGTVYDINGKDIVNVSLYIDEVLNETNSSGINDTNYIFTKTLLDGTHNWTYEACDNESTCNNASIRTFNIDTVPPTINIIYPPAEINYHIVNTNLSLNWTVSDPHLDSCWYNYNGTNVSVTCSDNHTNINITNYSNRNVTFYANDTFGLLNNDYQEWDYKIFENLKTYNLSSFETEAETFYMNITTNGIVPADVKLIYNETSYPATATNTYGNDYNVSRTIDIPTGIGNKNFFFNFTIAGTEISSPIQTQLINLTNFTHCVNGTPFINISFKNETISEEAVNATISSTWNYWLGSGTIFKTLSFSNASENPHYTFCLEGINRTLGTNASLIYKNSISQQRNFVGSFSLTNVTTNQTLYLLPTAEGLYVTFQVISISEQPIADVFSNVTKAGVLVGSGITDDAGTISYFLNPDSSYTFTFFKEGYDIYTTTLTPTQTTFTITLGAEEVIEVDDYTRGVTYSISPGAVSLVNGTNTYFNFTLTSTYWDVEEFGFNLTNQDGTLLDSTSASTNGGTVFILHNTSNDTTITMTFFWTIEGNISTSSVFWAVLDSSGRGFGLTTFFTHLTAYLNTEMFGLNSNSMVILIYIIIFITVGITSFKYGITSPTAISLMIFGLVFLFEIHLGWIPSISGFPILTILFAIVSIALILKEELR